MAEGASRGSVARGKSALAIAVADRLLASGTGHPWQILTRCGTFDSFLVRYSQSAASPPADNLVS